jgi:L-alanine-DL-glutamate epimerase-like enolase superfamily enzyme
MATMRKTMPRLDHATQGSEMTELAATIEIWPIAGEFRIARGAKREAVSVVATLRDGPLVGRGEATPYARYGETPDAVLAAIKALAPAVAIGMTREQLQSALPPGAARNALDCAFWDLEARRTGKPVWQLAGLAAPRPVVTAYSLSLDAPDVMAAKAAGLTEFPILKLKLAGHGDAERLAAVRQARPEARLIVDANEGFAPDQLPALFAMAAAARVEMIEQPLPQGHDQALADMPRPIPVCADESVHSSADIAVVSNRYDAVNIKLDKSGGLSEALVMAAAATRAGLAIMAGCMVASSLAMAPAMLMAQQAKWVDLDGPLLLARDREPALRYDGPLVDPQCPMLWG